MADILIKEGFFVTMDKQRRVIPNGSMYIADDKIISVGKSEEVQASIRPEFVIDAKHKIVIPGFVNVHTHLPSIFVRGVYGVVARGLTSVLFPIKSYIHPEDMYLFGLASCAEALYGGSTTIVETYNYLDHFARAVEKAGLRAVLGEQIPEADFNKVKDGIYEYLPEQAEAAFKRALDLIEKWHGRANGRVTTILAPLAPDMTTAETYLRCKESAETYDLHLTTHLSQSRNEIMQVKKMYGKTPPEHLNDIGLLDARLSGAHCTYVTEKDTVLLRKSGMGVLHCPRPYILDGVTVPLVEWLDIGIPVGLGTDNVYHSVNETMRAGLYATRVRAQLVDGSQRQKPIDRPSFYEFLELATLRGAEVMGIDKEVGSLEPGKKADVITFNMLSPHLMPTIESVSSIVLYGTSADIDTVIVDGRILKENGVLKSVDTLTGLQMAQEKTEDLWSRFFEDNPKQKALWKKSVHYNLNPHSP